jgi:hypothetical protein
MSTTEMTDMSDTAPESFWDAVARVQNDHNISTDEAMRVVRAEQKVIARRAGASA